MITSQTKLCCVIGNPVKHSLSPVIHNAGYQKLGLDFVYLVFDVYNLKITLLGLKEINVRGISVTVPFKQKIMKYLDKIDDTAKKIGAVNTVINENRDLIGSNTDWIGAIQALEEKTDLEGKTVALIGAGGAARAIAYGLKYKKAKVYVYNRTKAKADKLRQELDLYDSYSLYNVGIIKQADIIINATPVGMKPNDWESPIPAEFIQKGQIVFDIVYSPFETQFLKSAKIRGAKLVFGYKMLLFQGIEQFKLFTGKQAPVEVMEQALLKEIKLT